MRNELAEELYLQLEGAGCISVPRSTLSALARQNPDYAKEAVEVFLNKRAAGETFISAGGFIRKHAEQLADRAKVKTMNESRWQDILEKEKDERRLTMLRVLGKKFIANEWPLGALISDLPLWLEKFGLAHVNDVDKALTRHNELKDSHPDPKGIASLYLTAKGDRIRGEETIKRQELQEQPIFIPKVNVTDTDLLKTQAASLVRQRAHNLCKRWEGFNGYSEGGIISDGRQGRGLTDTDKVLKKCHGTDLQGQIERCALQFIDRKLYSKANPPYDIRVKHNWNVPVMRNNPLRNKKRQPSPDALKADTLPFVEDLKRNPESVKPQKIAPVRTPEPTPAKPQVDYSTEF